MLRIFQAAGLAFLFLPINFVSYTGIPQTQNNDVSGLTNLARNIGGSCGTAFLTTTLARRVQWHQNNMVHNLVPSSPIFQSQIHALSQVFVSHALAPNMTAAGFMAQAFIYQQMYRQSMMLSYLDVTSVLATGCFMMLPLVAMIGKIKRPKGDAPVH
jgi:DHA2 family multidrug resistance protein